MRGLKWLYNVVITESSKYPKGVSLEMTYAQSQSLYVKISAP